MTTILDRYVVRAVISGVLMVLLVLLGLGAFIVFVGQLGDVGTGSYRIGDAIEYALLTLPQQAFELFPMATLVGALMGLGSLAGHSELIVIRAAGVSVLRITQAVALAGLVLFAIAGALGEWIGPPTEQFARHHRNLSMNEQLSMPEAEGVWMKDGEVIVNVQQVLDAEHVGGVYTFTLDNGSRLKSIGYATSAGFDEQAKWRLENIQETDFTDQGVVASAATASARHTSLTPQLLALSVVDPDSLAIRGLFNYVQFLRGSGLDSHAYEVAFWSRLANTVSVWVMVLLALPFVFGPLRSAGAGHRLLVGVLFGLGYFLASKTMANSGEVFGLSPFLTAWLPTFVLAGGAVYGLTRVQ